MSAAAGQEGLLGREGLWAFSLRVYAAPGVADWCLGLQEDHGADVNVLLWCAWAGERGIRLADRELAAGEAAVAPWRQGVVAPLRQIRRLLKADLGAISAEMATALRTRVKAVELEAERVEQAALEAVALPPGAVGGTAAASAVAANVALYLGGLGAAETAADTLVAAVMKQR